MSTDMHDADRGRSPTALDAPLLMAAEVALTLVTVAAVASCARLFGDDVWVQPLMLAAVIAHVTMAAMRRLGRGLLATGAVALVAASLQVAWTHYASTVRAGIPTGATRDALDADISAAWNLFGEVKAPADSATGFIVVATVAIWVVAYLADWASFRLWSALETVLPSFALVIFVSFFGTADDRILLAAVYLAAIGMFQLVHRVLRDNRQSRWLADGHRRGTAALLKAGAALTVLMVVGAAVAGPALPGAHEQALIDLDQVDNGPDTRVVPSPIVDIRGRLVDQPGIEVFTVRSSAPSYWRLASLDEFDGQIWHSNTTYERADGRLPQDYDAAAAGVSTVEQTFDVTALDAVWLPAAYQPRRVVSQSNDSISYESLSGTLIVGNELDSSNGFQYVIESEIPTFDPAALAAAPNEYPSEVVDRYLGLPDDFSENARRVAQEVTANGANTYDKALALQDYFRAFTYSLDVGAGHSSSRIDAFLAGRVGYCEQFAGAFAAMARALNIPARVAVGFTWGDIDPADPDLYHVTGKHSHAWPEVFIPGSGWVAFEPTPTRGAPGAAQWTNVGAAQADDSSPALPDQSTEENPGSIAPPQFSLPQDLPLPQGGATGAAGAAARDSGGVDRWVKVTGLVLAGAAGLILLYATLMVGLRRARSHRRRSRAEDSRATMAAVWSETVEALGPLGLAPAPAETVREFCDRVGGGVAAASSDLTELGALTMRATYAPAPPADGEIALAEAHRAEVAAAVKRLTTPTQRWRYLLDPRR